MCIRIYWIGVKQLELYIFLFLLVVILSFLDFTTLDIRYKLCIMMSISIFFVMLSAIRWKTGTDWDMYYGLYHNNNNIEDFWNVSQNPQGQEFGYGLLNLLVKNTMDDYNVLLMIISLIILGIKFNWYNRYMPFPLIALFVNFSSYLGDIFFVRQSLAIAITIFAFRYIVSRSLYKFLFFICIATSIHTTALIFIPAYWIYNMNFSQKKLFFMLLICVVIDITKINVDILNEIFELFPSDSGKIAQKIFEYYTLSQSGESYGNAMDNSQRMFLSYFRRLVLVPLYLYLSSMIGMKNKYYFGCLNLVVFGYMLYFLASVVGTEFAVRLSCYYYVYEVLLITSLLLVFKSNLSRILAYGVIILYCLSKYMYIMYNLGDCYIPYVHVL